jgi:hypothetical protein
MLGSQPPRILHAPPKANSTGYEAIELAEAAGLVLDPWQQQVLLEGLGEKADGSWSAFQVGLTVPRQNGKGAILTARELAGLFVIREEVIIHTAHEFATAKEAFHRILELIEASPDLKRRVKSVGFSSMEVGIKLKREWGGGRLLFKARTSGGGRGFSADCVILDEAFRLPVEAHGALLPTVSARPNPQVWYATSAVDQKEHPHGVVMSQLRHRALAGADPSLCYMEWSVDEDVYYADPAAVSVDLAAWTQANPALGIRVSPKRVADEQRGMDIQRFARERLGIGDWPDPNEDASQVIARETWDGLADVHSTMVGTVAFAFDVNPERTYSAIAVSGVREDGRRHLEVIDHKSGTRWVVDRLVELVAKWGPCAIVVDGAGPAASLIAELETAGIGLQSDGGLLVKATAGDMAQACGALFDAALSDEVRHLGQSMLDSALRAARKRDRGDTFTWSRQSGSDISPLVAVTLASHGHAVYGRSEVDPALNVW